MDKIQKFLLKLSWKQRAEILAILEKILSGNTAWLDLRKLEWNHYLFRIRKGKIRIVFSSESGGNKIINLDYRDSIYNNLK